MLKSRIRHHTLPSIRHLSGLLISHAVTNNLFCPGQLYRFYLLRSKKLTIYYESEVVKLLASISQFNISATFTDEKGGTKDYNKCGHEIAVNPLAAVIPRSCSSVFSTYPLFRRGMHLVLTW